MSGSLPPWEAPDPDKLWIPDNPDGSGWADVDWGSVIRGSRYWYEHGAPHDEAVAALPGWYRVVTRLDSELLHAPHENSYYVPRDRLADFVVEVAMAGGVEVVWHVEPCPDPPPESHAKQVTRD